ncbi:hypothetical protein ACX0HA_08940 [Flavobacterium hauense]
MTYIRTNLAKPAGVSPGAPAPKEPNVTIVAVEDIATWPLRDPNKIKIPGSFVMKPNAKMIQFYQTSLKAKGSYETEGEDDNFRVKQKFETEIPGDDLETKEFVANWMGVDCIIIYGSCADPFRTVVGTKCAPVKLKPSSQDDNEARKKMLVFEQSIATEWFPGHYLGNLVLAEPFAATSGVFAINPTNGLQYKLPSLAVTDAIEPSEVTVETGQIVTFIGGGGVAPATLTNSTSATPAILLKSGSVWTGLANSVINLQVFDDGAKKYLIEVSRS